MKLAGQLEQAASKSPRSRSLRMFMQGVLPKGSGNVACSPLALHCGGKSYLGAQLDKKAAILPSRLGSRLNGPIVLSNM